MSRGKPIDSNRNGRWQAKPDGERRKAMEDMGMTDNQWKDNLRSQLEDWEDVEELLQSGKIEEALKKIQRVKNRINKGLED